MRLHRLDDFRDVDSKLNPNGAWAIEATCGLVFHQAVDEFPEIPRSRHNAVELGQHRHVRLLPLAAEPLLMLHRSLIRQLTTAHHKTDSKTAKP